MLKKRILLKEIYKYIHVYEKNLLQGTSIVTKAWVAYFTLGKRLLSWQDYKN